MKQLEEVQEINQQRKILHFRSVKDTSRSRTNRMLFIIFKVSQCWRSSFIVVETGITRSERCTFIQLLVSSDLRLLIKERRIFSKVVKISDFPFVSGWTGKYKHALSKSYSSQDNSYCVRLVIVFLAVNIGKLQPPVNNFFLLDI